MAFTFQVIRGSTTYTLSGDGLPIQLVSVDDLGGASVRNIEESGPFQDGSTHLDYRLEPSTFTLRFNVIGASAAALDGHRDTLNTIFKPVRGVPITLKVTRDDGAIRQIDTQRTGRLTIPLEPMNRPGNLHRAVVQLRAADPLWYDPDADTQNFLTPTNWWLGYNTIGTANVLEHAESPTAGQLWTNAGSVAAGSAHSIFIRSDYANGTADQYAFDARHPTATVGISFEAGTAIYAGGFFAADENNQITGALMTAGTQSYFFVTSGTGLVVYRGDTVAGSVNNAPSAPIPGTAAGTARWRRQHAGFFSDWPVALPFAAVYNIELSELQRESLTNAVTIGSAYSANIGYTGDVDTYPTITITGPFANPVLTNAATGDVLDFTGGTVGSADIWTIDTRYGRKSVLNAAGSSVANYLSTSSDLATWRLVPAPLAIGGTNTITLSGSAISAAAAVAITFNTRYLSY